ncbi:aminopeptidase, partial [Erysipelatoclostridium ramosum]|nr:aminopeptidase [Thomasclavelia ramosa]
DAGKTERECVALAAEMAKEAGYKDLNAYIAEDKQLKTGDKVYAVWMHKMVALFQIGEEPISNGMNILGA